VTGVGSAHAPDTWTRLRARVERLAAEVSVEGPRAVGKRWYEEVYRPLVGRVIAHGLKRRFPGARRRGGRAREGADRWLRRPRGAGVRRGGSIAMTGPSTARRTGTARRARARSPAGSRSSSAGSWRDRRARARPPRATPGPRPRTRASAAPRTRVPAYSIRGTGRWLSSHTRRSEQTDDVRHDRAGPQNDLLEVWPATGGRVKSRGGAQREIVAEAGP
jgi:hypothetical protein